MNFVDANASPISYTQPVKQIIRLVPAKTRCAQPSFFAHVFAAGQQQSRTIAIYGSNI
jgi:hypothetical protein